MRIVLAFLCALSALCGSTKAAPPREAQPLDAAEWPLNYKFPVE